jgi:hypothetical protein
MQWETDQLHTQEIDMQFKEYIAEMTKEVLQRRATQQI